MIRKQSKSLIEWYNSKRRKPLVIWGARQVGKTYLVKDLFLKDNFKDYVYIDLKIDKEACDFFKTTCNPEDYLKYIQLRYHKTISNNVPLVFDEVQQCHNVLTALKYFCQDHPELPVIATGSMVRLSLGESDPDFLFPVGKINSINLYPLTFEEYLMNKNEMLYEMIKNGYKNKSPLEPVYHNMALDALYEFLSIGGMPEVVDAFLTRDSYEEVVNVRTEIYNNYIRDMESYNISNEMILKTRNVYMHIYEQLNKENKNFKITRIDKGKSNRDYFSAYNWLELANVVYRSNKKDGKVRFPLTQENEGLFRLYLSDPGMFSYESNVSDVDFFVKDKRNTLAGIFYENYVADEFVAKGISLYYWCGKYSFEFEFIVQNQDRIVPIDVKKTGGKLNSLKEFRNSNPKYVAVKISANNYGFDKENLVLTIPLYEVFMLADDIAKDVPLY